MTEPIDWGKVVTAEAKRPQPAAFAAAIQQHIDGVAAERGYGSGVSLASYAASTVPAWAAEAAAFIAWRDAVWGYAYAELDRVARGERAHPTIAGLIAELPPMAWPDGG